MVKEKWQVRRLKLRIKEGWLDYLQLWQKAAGRKKYIFYILHYTIIFSLVSICSFSAFYGAEKTFIWNVDGMGSHMPKLIYISKVFQQGLQSLLHGDSWTIPIYDFRIGPVPLELQRDLFDYLAAIWPYDKMDQFYNALVVIRCYAVGLSFSAMGFAFQQKMLPILIGSLSYVFCGFSLCYGIRHPFFFTLMFFLPLLVMGAEKILKKKRALSFTLAVFLSLLSSLYLSYILAILIFLYILVRFFCSYKREGWKGFCQTIVRTAIWGGTGIALSGIVTIPTLLQMMDTGRVGRTVEGLWHYSLAEYERFFTSFTVIANDLSYYSCLGFSILAVPAICLLFLEKRKNRQQTNLKMLFLLSTGMFCSPAAAYVLSGFNAVSARWCVAYALCISAIIMFEIPHMQSIGRAKIAAIDGLILAYAIMCQFAVKEHHHNGVVVLLLLMAALLSLCLASGQRGNRWFLPLCLGLTCLSVYYSAFLKYDATQQNYISEFMTDGIVYPTYESRQYGVLGTSNIIKSDNSFFRVSASNLGKTDANMAFYWDMNGLSFFSNSLIPSYKTMLTEMEILQRGENNDNFGIEARAPLLSLLNVKYFAAREGTPTPYGFEAVDQRNTDHILRNQFVLPLGYTYKHIIDEAWFDTLSAIEKQEAMLQGIVIAGNTAQTGFASKEDIKISSQKLPVTITTTEGLAWQDGVLQVSQENAVLTLSFAGVPNADTYLRVVNLDLTSGERTTRWNLTASAGDTINWARFQADAYIYANGAKTQIMYLGNSEDGYTSCTVTFPTKGTYILDDLEIWCQPMADYAVQIEALRAEPLENIEINWRGVTGTVTLSTDKVMCFGIPYETGWSVYVDGIRQQLREANVGLMAVELPAGAHSVELCYWTPGLTAGIVLTCLGALCACVFTAQERKRASEGPSARAGGNR